MSSLKEKYNFYSGSFQKRNAERCYRARYTRQALSEVNQLYRRANLPYFVRDFLCASNQSDQYQVVSQNKNLMLWEAEGTFVFLPNTPHILDPQILTGRPETYKDRPEGLSLCGWYIHPVFRNQNGLDNRRLDAVEATNLSQLFKARGRGYYLKTIGDIENETGIPYLASVLDLNADHVNWLKVMEKRIWEYLHSVFKVNEKDEVQIYFHPFYPAKTATLHIHVRVNHALHPLDVASSLFLREVIEHLEQGNNIVDLLLSKSPYHEVDTEKILFSYNTPGVSVELVENPFKIDLKSYHPDARLA